MAIGVTTNPMSHGIGSFAFSSAYVWFGDQNSHGLGASQTKSTARMSRWKNMDRLTLTLDCDKQLLHLQLHRTGEQKTISMSKRGHALYLYAYLADKGQIIDIL